MSKFSMAIVKSRFIILIVSIVLLIPSLVGIISTRINYDMLNYLPKDMETVIGQDILLEDFGKGAFSLVMLDDMKPKDVSKLKTQIENVDHVATVIWYDDIMDLSVPMELLPKKYYDVFNNGNTTMLAVFFDTSTSADETMEAIKNIKSIAGKQCYVSGMSALVTDLKDLCEREEPIYVAIAVILACVVMMIFLDSPVLPILFLTSIGIAIVWNLGSNVLIGEISYITKALSAVLQLAVTMDYSIFLWHSYKEQKEIYPDNNKKAMAEAITCTITSVVGSSITTVAGFIALCFMSFTLGFDLGLVMAKGVIFGVIGCITVLPSLILVFDKAITKTMHKEIMIKTGKISDFVTRKFFIFTVIFLIILGPAYYGYKNVTMYYDFSAVLPQSMDYSIANNKLKDTFNVASTHMILVDSSLKPKKVKEMTKEIEALDGVKFALGLDSVVGSMIPEELIPKDIESDLKSDRYQLLIVNSEFGVATDEVNKQIDDINTIIKKYDSGAMLIGEAPCTKDMITITDHDFKVVNMISIIAIFVIILFVTKSITLPIILVSVIEFAIFINLGIPYYTNVQLPFIGPICISTIQLGATVDYAILMTTRYKKERFDGNDKATAIITSLETSIPSIIVSALGFFAATYGVSVYSDIDIISSLCTLMSRGAIISMFCVIFILPSFFMIFDKIICHTSIGFIDKSKSKELKKVKEAI